MEKSRGKGNKFRCYTEDGTLRGEVEVVHRGEHCYFRDQNGMNWRTGCAGDSIRVLPTTCHRSESVRSGLFAWN